MSWVVGRETPLSACIRARKRRSRGCAYCCSTSSVSSSGAPHRPSSRIRPSRLASTSGASSRSTAASVLPPRAASVPTRARARSMTVRVADVQGDRRSERGRAGTSAPVVCTYSLTMPARHYVARRGSGLQLDLVRQAPVEAVQASRRSVAEHGSRDRGTAAWPSADRSRSPHCCWRRRPPVRGGSAAAGDRGP